MGNQEMEAKRMTLAVSSLPRETGENAPSSEPPHKISRWKLLLFFGLAAVVIGGLALMRFLTPYYVAAHAVNLDHLNELPVSTMLVDRKGTVLGYLYAENRIILQPTEIPPRVRQAFVAAEDRRFYTHYGLDPRGIVRAALVNVKKSKIVQGGSTITQQLAKLAIGDSRRTWDRKLREAFLALRLEDTFTKDEILTYYLNRIYFGSGYFGLAAASEGYFGKKITELTTQEAALLAAVVRAPSTYSPSRSYERAVRRSHAVMEIMEALQFISLSERLDAQNAPPRIKEKRLTGPFNHYRARLMQETEQILELAHREQVPQGLRIYTTLHADLQKQVETLVEEEARRLGASSVPGAADQLEAAAVVLDPATGQILAYVGGRSFDKRQFDHVNQARRQSPALLDPWIAGLGIEILGLSPVSLLDSSYGDEPVLLQTTTRESLLRKKPDANAILLHDALVYGSDFALLRLAGAVGPKPLDALLERAGIPRGENRAPFTLMEMTSLYGALASSGSVEQPRLILKIETYSGEVLYQAENRSSPRLFTDETRAEIRWALLGKAEEGSARKATLNAGLQIPRALYHGSTAGWLDSSCVGITPRLSAGVWLGWVGNKGEMFSSQREAEEAAVPLWTHVIDAAALTLGSEGAFARPSSLSEVEIDRRDARIKGFHVLDKSPGNLLVLLTQKQINALQPQAGTAETGSPPVSSWSQWFGNILASDKNAKLPLPSVPHPGRDIIPEKLEFILPGVRGSIVTRDNDVLAGNAKLQALVCTWPPPADAAEDEAVLQAVRKKIELVQQELGVTVDLSDQEILERYRFRRFQPLELAPVLSQAQTKKFLASRLEKLGLALQGYPRRVYPRSFTLSHLLGYLRKNQSPNPSRYQAGEVAYDEFSGASGLEALFDQRLRGSNGLLKIETRQDGFLNKVFLAQPSEQGLNLRLTIHSRWQHALDQAVRGGSIPAAGVIMDVRNGDILAMSSFPDFNPNDFIPRMNPETWEELSKNPFQPLLSRAYRQHYPPGSVFKIVTTIASMQAGTFDPNRRVTCNGYYQVGNVLYTMPREKGVVDFHRGMALSFNTYFFDMALHTPRAALIAAGQAAGFGQKTGFLLPNEEPGRMPTPEFVLQTHQRIMGPGDITNTAIGQGDVLATPLQIAHMMVAVANRGTLFAPRLVLQMEKSNGQAVEKYDPIEQGRLNLSEDQWNRLHDALRAVVTEGTAQPLQMDALSIAAKTGTAQLGNAKDRRIAWVAGFAPFDKPQVAFVFMAEGQSGEEVSGYLNAVPMARATLESVLSAPDANP
jgi:penicillin-binding protein 2